MAMLLGEIRGDVKHILSGLTAVKADINEIDQRLVNVEKFQTRATAYVPALIFVITLAGNSVVDWFVARFFGG